MVALPVPVPASPIEIPPAFGLPTVTTPFPHPATVPTSSPGAGDPPATITPSDLLTLPSGEASTPAWDAEAARLNKAATDKAMPVNFTFAFAFVFMSNLISVGQPRNSSSDDAWTLPPAKGARIVRGLPDMAKR
ncbi:hypothetical protein A8E76_05790 [Burkholderia cenocepacia]|nr:hypothetical protein A8E76_05790 [Burkholderia cenocepacia]